MREERRHDTAPLAHAVLRLGDMFTTDPRLRMDSVKMNAAVQECLETCYESLKPLDCLSSYTARLRADPAWEAAEVREFEAVARRMLAELLSA